MRLIVDTKGNRVRLAAVNWYGAKSADYVVGGLQLQPLQTIAVIATAADDTANTWW
jgi:endoglucanase